MAAPFYVYDLLTSETQVRWGAKNPLGTPVTITFGFLASSASLNFTPFTAAEMTAARKALAYISSFTNITFQETDGASAQIAFDNADLSSRGASGIAEYKYTDAGILSAKVSLSNTGPGSVAGSSFEPGSITADDIGGYPWQVLLHEVGHALGLKHPFQTNNAGDPNSVLPSNLDDRSRTVMSYTSYQPTNVAVVNDLGDGRYSYQYSGLSSQTYGLYDIAALQYLYGAKPSSSGNKVFSFKPDAPVMRTLYETGPNNTIDASALPGGNTIDLNPGATSRLAIAQTLGFGITLPSPYDGRAALTLAYGSTIADAIGGAGADTITGNALANRLDGGNGNDTIDGGAGKDTIQGGLGTNTLIGGDGMDTAVYAVARAAATVTTQNGVTTMSAAGINDTLTGFEFLKFTDQTVSLGGAPAARAGTDLNGDMTSDVLFQSSSSVVGWRVQNGQVQSLLNLGDAGSYQAAATGDLNGDGTSDIVFQQGGSIVDWQMQGGQVQSSTGLGNAGSHKVVGTGDFNGDSTADLLFQQGGSVIAWQMQNGQVQSSTGLGNAGSYQVVGTGDLNGDGTDDIVFQDGASVVAWVMGNGQVQNVANLGTAGGYRVAGVGDLNGDGRADLVFQNGASVVDWIMGTGGQVQSANTLGNAGGYAVSGVGDYTGDGTADVLFQQGASVVGWGVQDGQVQSLLNLGNAGSYTAVA